MRTLPISILLGLMLCGCPDSPALCSDCPRVEGRYDFTYAGFDGGSDGSPDCASVLPPVGPSSVEIFRNGALLHATLNGISCTGQISDTSDFSLNGTETLGGDADNVRTVSLHGFYQAATTKDGGGTIQATWTTHTEQGAKACDADQKCIGLQR